MALVTGVISTIFFGTLLYIGLGFVLAKSILFWKDLATAPTTRATKKLSSFNIDFKHVGYGGPDIADKICIPTEYMKKGVEVCFWIEKRELVASEPYYPKDIPLCKAQLRCRLEAKITAGIQAQFHPHTGLAPMIIPPYIDPKIISYNASMQSTVRYETFPKMRIWARSFYWLYEGYYTITTRPFDKFSFNFTWPSLLPSGEPNSSMGTVKNMKLKPVLSLTM